MLIDMELGEVWRTHQNKPPFFMKVEIKSAAETGFHNPPPPPTHTHMHVGPHARTHISDDAQGTNQCKPADYD
jgi:hypothetical protein